MIDPFIQQARLALDYETLDTLRYGRLVNADASKVQRGGHDQVEFLNVVMENRLLEYLSGEGVDIDFKASDKLGLRVTTLAHGRNSVRQGASLDRPRHPLPLPRTHTTGRLKHRCLERHHIAQHRSWKH